MYRVTEYCNEAYWGRSPWSSRDYVTHIGEFDSLEEAQNSVVLRYPRFEGIGWKDSSKVGANEWRAFVTEEFRVFNRYTSFVIMEMNNA